MVLNLMYITNEDKIAKIAEKSGVDWIFIDLELNGKDQRQGHLDTVISRHDISDVKKISNVLTSAQLLVRVNPIYEGSKEEIERVIQDGADIVMLPFFKTKKEVETFIGHIGGRAKVCLLCETSEAVEDMDSILELEGIDYIHVGLNDLHLSYGMDFMFELLADGTVEALCNKFEKNGIVYGFGGIAQLGNGSLAAEYIIAEHYRLNSSMVILSRSFCNHKSGNYDEVDDIFNQGIKEIREYEESLLTKDCSFYRENNTILKKKVLEISNTISRKITK